MKSSYSKLLCVSLFLCIPVCVYSQQAAIKTNLLYWATTTPNLGVEIALSEKLTLDLQGAYNPWMFSGKEENQKLKHWLFQPEIRWWRCERFTGSFFGVHLHGGGFNMSAVKLPAGIFKPLREHRYEGWFAGGGVSYGYQWFLGDRWNLQAIIGVGYTYIDYEKYQCRRCGGFIKSGGRHYVGPTKIGISLVYLL